MKTETEPIVDTQIQEECDMQKIKNNPKNIPYDLLQEFIQQKISNEDKRNVTNITAGFLWEISGIQRHRINVWMQEEVEESICPKNYIGYSWFVHYCVLTNTLIER